jgi:methionyl-tRNA formyltransferase
LSVGHETIRSDDTTASLSERMSHLGAQLMVDTLPKYLSGEIAPQPQPEEGITYSPKINKADAQIDWHKPAVEIERMVRAYIPWPGTQTTWDGQMVKVLKAEIGDRGSEIRDQVGLVVKLGNGSIGVMTGNGVLVLKEIQLAGRKAMKAEDFVRGQPKFIGAILG